MKSIRVGELSIGEGRPKICVPMVGSTREELRREADKIVELKPDLVEWRGDFFGQIDDFTKVKEQLKVIKDRICHIPLLFTFRSQKEGGNKEISVADYVNLNQLVSKTGLADLVDVELFFDKSRGKELISSIQEEGSKVIASNHEFFLTPSVEVMTGRLLEMDVSGADILKLAVMPSNAADVLNLLTATNQMKELTQKPVVTMSMGGLGLISRLSGEIFGSAISFGALENASAPGQIPLSELKNMLQLLEKYVNI